MVFRRNTGGYKAWIVFRFDLFGCMRRVFAHGKRYDLPGIALLKKEEGNMEQLKPYRMKIDEIDDRIIDLLAQRLDTVRDVAVLKAACGIPAVLEDRVEEVRDRCAKRGASKGLDEALVRRLYTLIITHACDTEEDIISTL